MHRLEALDSFYVRSGTKEEVRLYDDKICISGAQGADVTGLGAQEFRCRGFGLSSSVESGNLGLVQGRHPADVG
jgi:hypothetical protein